MDVHEALADPVRRELLAMLRSRPCTAGELAEPFTISRPAISRHLRLLRSAGLVVADGDEADGRLRRYHLDLAPLAEVDGLLASLRATPPRQTSTLDALATEVARAGRDRRRVEARRLADHEPPARPRRRTSA